MTEPFLQTLMVEIMTITLKLSLPMLIAGLGVGLVVSVLQAVTQVQEMTLTFVPKIAAVAMVLLVAGPWMLDSLMAFTIGLYSYIPQMTVGMGG